MIDGPGDPALRESDRDQAETMFTPALRSLFLSDASVAAVVFVDSLGECVDYCGGIDPYEAKIVGAQMQVVISNLGPSLEKLAVGELGELHVHAERYEFVVRRIDAEYSCIVMRREGGSDDAMLSALEDTVHLLRELSGLAVPPWDVRGLGLSVTVRSSQGWGYAPEVVVDSGAALQVDAVLGRWEESGGLTGRPLVCFRVHTEDGRDSTLVYDEGHERWYRW
jgi:hypothetical protein